MKDKLKVLVVEDDAVDYKIISQCFNDAEVDFDIDRAIDGEKALEFIENFPREKFLVVLLDLNLPKVSGIEVLQELRKNDLNKNSLVFIYSSSRAAQDLQFAYDECVAGYLVKESTLTKSREQIKLLSNYLSTIEFPVCSGVPNFA